MTQYNLQAQMKTTECKAKADALADAQAWTAKNGGRILTAPEVQLVTLRDAKNGKYRQNWYTSTTEELIGKTAKGSGVVLYGSNVLLGTPKKIRSALARGVTGIGAGKLNPKEFKTVLSGKLPNGKSIPVFEVSYLKNNEGFAPNGVYAVSIPLEDARKAESGYHNVDSLLENGRFIARAGSMPVAKAIVQAAKKAGYETLGDYAWVLKHIDLEDGAQGLLVAVLNRGNGFGDDDNLGSDGSFVWVAPEAPVAQNSDTALQVKARINAGLRSQIEGLEALLKELQ